MQAEPAQCGRSSAGSFMKYCKAYRLDGKTTKLEYKHNIIHANIYIYTMYTRKGEEKKKATQIEKEG